MWKDEIVEEVRRIRNKNAAKSSHDIDAIVEGARRRQHNSERNTVSFPPRKPKVYTARKSVVEKA